MFFFLFRSTWPTPSPTIFLLVATLLKWTAKTGKKWRSRSEKQRESWSTEKWQKTKKFHRKIDSCHSTLFQCWRFYLFVYLFIYFCLLNQLFLFFPKLSVTVFSLSTRIRFSRPIGFFFSSPLLLSWVHLLLTFLRLLVLWLLDSHKTKTNLSSTSSKYFGAKESIP